MNLRINSANKGQQSKAAKKSQQAKPVLKRLTGKKNNARNIFVAAVLSEMNRKRTPAEKAELARFKSVMQEVMDFCDTEKAAARLLAWQVN